MAQPQDSAARADSAPPDLSPNATVAAGTRRRILGAALALAAECGYDEVQVRALSKRAGVSSRTIYTHFPSLDSLLIVAIIEQAQPMYGRLTDAPPAGATPAARVDGLITRLTETITANRSITVALIRALHGGKPDVAPYVHQFGATIQGMFLAAIAPDGPTPRDRDAAAVLESVWFHAVVNWATGPEALIDPAEIMRRALGTLFEARAG
jgi:TetR/AcrR family transcriptional regulator, cholesterol catabolism regulator